MHKFQLVIFDMDGLMFDTERLYCEETAREANKKNISIDMSVLYRAVGSNNCFNEDAFFLYAPVPNDVKKAILHDSVDNAVEQMMQNGVPKKDGLDALLMYLKSNNIKLCVATSTAISRTTKLLYKAGVDHYFDFIITAADVEHGKPAPDIFLKACKYANVLPEESLVIEDSINGSLAALAGNIPYIVIPDLNVPTDEIRKKALLIGKTLFDVITVLETSNDSNLKRQVIVSVKR